jgi:hypothetical protein
MVNPVEVYSNLSTRFGLVDGEHPTGHKGQDFRLPNGGGSVIPAYEECVVVESGTEVTKGFTAILGWYVVARSLRDGKYLGWAHLRRGTRPAVGTVLKPGDQVGLAASGPRPPKNLGPTEAGINYPGTAWAGAHIHTTLSTTIPGIFAGPTYDPLPRIQAALTSLAGSGETYTAIENETEKEEDMPLTQTDVDLILNTRIKVRGGKATVSVQEALSAAWDLYDGVYYGAQVTGGVAIGKVIGDTLKAAQSASDAASATAYAVTPGAEGVKTEGELHQLIRTVAERPVATAAAPADPKAVATALTNAGLVSAVAKATADENDKRARARLG